MSADSAVVLQKEDGERASVRVLVCPRNRPYGGRGAGRNSLKPMHGCRAGRPGGGEQKQERLEMIFAVSFGIYSTPW